MSTMVIPGITSIGPSRAARTTPSPSGHLRLTRRGRVVLVAAALLAVLAAGFFLGSPDHADAGIVPNLWIQALVGYSPQALLSVLGHPRAVAPAWLSFIWPLWTNLFASVTGALMYFATLTEVPILRGLLDSGMGQGPALALLLAGPALSLPSMLVINSILGPRKTLTFIGLVIAMATVTGVTFGVIVR